MPKLKLVPEDLTVTSFDATATDAAATAAALVPSHNTACVTCRTMCAPYC
jgi:hypothetical protein